MALGSKNEVKIISDDSEIERLLTKLKNTSKMITIEALGRTYVGEMRHIGDVTLSFGYNGLISSMAGLIDVEIISGKDVYQFVSPILDMKDCEMTVSMPNEVKVLIKRKYNRIDITEEDGASVGLTISSDSMPSADSSKVVPKYAKIFQELSNTLPNVGTIMTLIKKHLEEYTDDSKIELYKSGEKRSLHEEIIKSKKEAFYVKNTREQSAYLNNFMPKVISLGDYLKYLKNNGYNDEKVKEVMLKVVGEDRRKGYKSYLYAPITLFGDVVGHIYIANSRSEFSDQNIYVTISMAEVISEAFVKSKLFQLKSAGEIEAKMLDISAGGTLIEVNDPYVMKFIVPDTKLNLSVKLREVTNKIYSFQCVGRVLRAVTADEKNKVALKFLELKWNDQDKLDKIVNKKIEFNRALP